MPQLKSSIPQNSSFTPRRRSRPPIRVSRYTVEEGFRICERILDKPQPLAALCQEPGMPSIATLVRWLRKYPEFRDAYELAKELQVEHLIFEMNRLVDDASNDLITTPDGRTIPNLAAIEHLESSLTMGKRLAVKLLPRKFR